MTTNNDIETFTMTQIRAELANNIHGPVDEILNRAADLIEQEGLSRGQFYRQGEGYCALGAIRKAEFGTTNMFVIGEIVPADYAEEDATTTPTGWLWKYLGSKPIAWWNDDPSTTKEDVVRTLRDAADKYTNR